MANTYTYSGTPSASDRDRLRLEISDTGLPGTAGGTVWMFSDAEIAFFVDTDSTWNERIAHACETLARQWSRIPSITADGLRVDQRDVATAYAARAKELRESPGFVTPTSVDVTRKDGYSDDYNSREADTVAQVDPDTIDYVKGFPLQWDAPDD